MNPDLPPSTARLMALSACGARYGRRILETAMGQALPRLPFRDASWRYWQALDLAGLGHLWPEFVTGVKGGGVRLGAQALRERCDPTAYMLWLRRLGTNPHNDRKPSRDIVWTKGGIWRIASPLTKLLVLKQHLPPRPHWFKWHVRIDGPAAIQIERELWGLINPDAKLPGECKWQAVEYVQRRIPEMLGHTEKAPLTSAAWFFQQDIPGWDGGKPVALVPDTQTGYVRRSPRQRRIHDQWSW